MISHYFAEALIKANDIGIPMTRASGIKGILNTVYFWAGALAVVFIIISAYRFVISNGDSSQIVQARRGIIAALVGIVVVFSAFVITNFIIDGF